MTNHGRAQKRRGYTCEKKLEARLAPYGFGRVIMSGQLGGRLSGDFRHASWDPLREDVGGRPRVIGIVEGKQRRGGQRRVRQWLAQGGAHLLLLHAGGTEEPLAILRLDVLCDLLEEAGYGTTP